VIGPLDLARRYFPDLDDRHLDAILWECTGFPGFWHIPRDGRGAAQCLNTQLSRIARRSGGSYDRAMKLADHLMGQAMSRLVLEPEL
jgi:hypothetical protein